MLKLDDTRRHNEEVRALHPHTGSPRGPQPHEQPDTQGLYLRLKYHKEPCNQQCDFPKMMNNSWQYFQQNRVQSFFNLHGSCIPGKFSVY